ncbi:MalY/PatB family protein [Vibrio penaeicida]|uniref:cysteine-S-conjugate beta-lyase n=1 Tax=Vibrio penaeicida TaxID=104609 RepID=A0AAV5NLU8_9VIBR|nr:MalY/PatB family protein [Vibrio penaeicida]RTZ22534.1 pyridoxal phosphate-dependent aminotransferase [Vibrio penaeicida]GLQ71488.1 cystathionine beta-lyase [Vibrio penaeicida]
MSSLFDKPHNRRGTGSVKWDFNQQKFGDVSENAIPMWVSDYDFSIPPQVSNALQSRLEHGVFGYTEVTKTYFESIQTWYQEQHQLDLDTDWVVPVNGVMPGIALVIEQLTNEGDSIAVQSPGYGKFKEAIALSGREVEEITMVEESGCYEMDFNAIEAALASGIKAFILCNPHNPIGRIWSPEEVQAIAQLCHRYDVWLISDEIWCDLALPGYQCWSALNLEERYLQKLVVTTAATKTFGLASLRLANLIIPNPTMRGAIEKRKQALFLDLFDAMAIVASQTAYTTSLSWLNDLKLYVQGNMEFLNHFLSQHIPALSFQMPQCGYLVWVDCRALNLSDEALRRLFIDVGVLPSVGTEFGAGGSGYVRLNLGCSRDTLKQACQKLLGSVDLSR